MIHFCLDTQTLYLLALLCSLALTKTPFGDIFNTEKVQGANEYEINELEHHSKINRTPIFSVD